MRTEETDPGKDKEAKKGFALAPVTGKGERMFTLGRIVGFWSFAGIGPWNPTQLNAYCREHLTFLSIGAGVSCSSRWWMRYAYPPYLIPVSLPQLPKRQDPWTRTVKL